MVTTAIHVSEIKNLLSLLTIFLIQIIMTLIQEVQHILNGGSIDKQYKAMVRRYKKTQQDLTPF